MKKIAALFSLFICFATISAKAQTSQLKVLVDNDKVKVTQYYSLPGEGACGKGKHSHPAHLTVLLTDAEVTITGADGITTTQKAPAGTTFWSDAETHEVINSGKLPMKLLIIETKK
jgi:hypothetical protein